MTVQSILIAVIVAVCLFLAWKFLSSVVRFAFPARVRHKRVDDIVEPDDALARQLKQMGFSFLGARSESIGLLWRRRAAVFVLDRRVVADVPIPSSVKGAYLLTFFPDGGCALTRTGPERTVEENRYRSVGSPPKDGFAGLLSSHRKNESVVGMGDEPEPVPDMGVRLTLAEKWYRKYARIELLWPACIGIVLSAGVLSFGVYAVMLLSQP